VIASREEIRSDQEARAPDPLVLAFDLAATVLFALEGATLGVAAHLDLLGVLVVGFATALGGGIIRDILLDAGQPAALRYKRYAIAAFVGSFIVFLFSDEIREIPTGTLVALDAAGLSAYAVSGAAKSIDFGTNTLTAILLGGVTAVGGGVIRDVLVIKTPIVLVADFYATAALIGAAVMVFGVRSKQPMLRMMWIGAATCFTLRMLGYWNDWNLPHF
jgi:uncharacterized membrane protein YeiH